MIRNLIWGGIARILTIPTVTDWLIARAHRTPYTHITSKDGTDVYMGRWWLFNPYPHEASTPAEREVWDKSWRGKVPSIRVHHIRRHDADRHLHDHPWNARTIILRGGYLEERPANETDKPPCKRSWLVFAPEGKYRWNIPRSVGYTGRLLFGEYHRIRRVPPEGAWTLFITWKKQGTWGFLVDGTKVPWRKYLGLEPKS